MVFWTETNFNLGLLSLGLVSPKIDWGSFCSASRHQHIHIGFVSLGLLDPTKFDVDLLFLSLSSTYEFGQTVKGLMGPKIGFGGVAYCWIENFSKVFMLFKEENNYKYNRCESNSF